MATKKEKDMNNFKQLVDKLINKNWTIASAESCTGGMFASSIVDIADASKVLNASVVTYANSAKVKYAMVSEKTLEQYGAVSEQVAGEMAIGIAKANEANVGVSFSGIAGPGGGTDTKPVGMVCMGFYVDGKLTTETKVWADMDRTAVRQSAVKYACDRLNEMI